MKSIRLIKKYSTFFIPFCLLIIVLYSCSTKKNTFTRRAYHNVTARYNGYFNGNESLKEGVAILNTAHQDDYTKILPIYRLGTAKDAANVNSQMDVAFKKATVVIKRHSIFIKSREYVKMIPESYMMIAKSHFYKQDYRLALDVFEYIIKQYKEFPIKYEAMLWAVRCNNNLKKFDKSLASLDIVEDKVKQKQAPQYLKKIIPIVYSDFYLKQENYTSAVESLKKAIEVTTNRKLKSRLIFILAQVYQKLGNNRRATDSYLKVLKRNPPYEMAFNAKLSMAKCYDKKSLDSRQIKKELENMIKDAKNTEYLDQIYYSLAEIALKENDIDKAIEYLKLSCQANQKNTVQKSLSYLKLADIYYGMPDYEKAQMFYDSTLTVLSKEHPEYNNIIAKRNTLTDLVLNLKTIYEQDSLLRLSKLSVQERNDFINKIIAKIVKDKQEKQKKENEERQNNFLLSQNTQSFNNPNSPTGGGSAKWYFYNPSTVSFGYAEFKRKFGDRKLEDNWRLSNKEASNDDFFNANNNNALKDSTDSDSTYTKGKDGKKKDKTEDVAYYSKNIPTTPEKIKAANNKIEDAFYTAGVIYKEGLKDNEHAIKAFNELLVRYPDSKYLLYTYFQLYRIYIANKNQTEADIYKNLILNKYPDSDFAKLIKDPNYTKTITESQNAIEQLYQSTYLLFIDNKLDQVIANNKLAHDSFPNDELLAKFDYLKALALGSIKGLADYENELKNIVEKYKSGEIKIIAQEALDYIATKKDSSGNFVKQAEIDAPETSVKSIYKFNSEAFHFIEVITDIRFIRTDDIKLRLSNFNSKKFSTSSFNIGNLIFNDTLQLITISRFNNKNEAMNYFNALISDETVFAKYDFSKYKIIVISEDNYPVFYKDKDIDLYMEFFNKNYFNKDTE